MTIEEIAVELLKGIMAGHLGVVIIQNPETNLEVIRGSIETAKIIKREIEKAR